MHHAELIALAKLVTAVDATGLPVRLEFTDHLKVHLGAPLDGAQEAHLLNLAAHGARSFNLDPIHGPELPPQMRQAKRDAAFQVWRDRRPGGPL